MLISGRTSEVFNDDSRSSMICIAQTVTIQFFWIGQLSLSRKMHSLDRTSV